MFIYGSSKIHISRGSDFPKSDFTNGCEIWIIIRGLVVEYFYVLYFSTIFNDAGLFSSCSIEDIQGISF